MKRALRRVVYGGGFLVVSGRVTRLNKILLKAKGQVVVVKLIYLISDNDLDGDTWSNR